MELRPVRIDQLVVRNAAVQFLQRDDKLDPARCEPRQRCTPAPKDRCRLGRRSMSSSSGFPNSFVSQLAAHSGVIN